MEDRTLTLVGGCSVVEHGDIRSFLKEDTFSILSCHRDRSKDKYYLTYLEKKGFLKRIAQSTKRSIFSFDHPIILHPLVVLTNRCNMDCDYCYTEANDHLNEDEINKDKWKNIFDSIKIPGSRRIQNLSFTGGEPTCHPDFIDIFNYVSGKFKVEVSTNGLRLTERHFNAFENFDGLMKINISMDSCYSEEDEIMRGTNTYQKRLENLTKLCERDIPTCLGMVVNGITINSIKDTTRYFLDKFPNLKMKYLPISRMGKAMKLDKRVLLSKDNAKKYVQDVSEMIKLYGEQILTDPTSHEDNGEPQGFHWSGRCTHMKYESEKNMYRIKTTDDILLAPERCNAAYGVVSLSPSGSLKPCLRANSFYEDILDAKTKQRLIPSLVGLSFEGIGHLPFWKDVKKTKCGFNPLETCALKFRYGEKNGS